MTAFYMFRLFFMTFAGTSRVPHEVEHHLHESPKVMTYPLIALAAGAVAAGWIGWPSVLGGSNHFEHFLEPIFENPALRPLEHHVFSLEFGLMFGSVVVAAIGAWIAYRWYVKNPEVPERVAQKAGPLYQLVLEKYRVDELYDLLFVNRVKNLGNGLAAFDLGVVDGAVNGAGWTTRMTAELSRIWDLYVIDGIVNLIGFVAKLFSYPMRIVQTGLVQNYALLITLGVLAFMAYYLLHF
jgi:NADH-quinone oxidoreductase subunit L